jgi:hypothetical protein
VGGQGGAQLPYRRDEYIICLHVADFTGMLLVRNSGWFYLKQRGEHVASSALQGRQAPAVCSFFVKSVLHKEPGCEYVGISWRPGLL